MGPPPSSRRASHLIGAGAVLALLAGLAVMSSPWWRPAPPPGSIPALGDTSDAVVDRALEQIPADSLALKSRWMDEVRNVDLAKLDEPRLAIFVRHANAQRCTCGCGYTLAACRTYDPTCPVSGPILEALRDSVAAGLVHDVRGLRERPRTGSGSHPS